MVYKSITYFFTKNINFFVFFRNFINNSAMQRMGGETTNLSCYGWNRYEF